MVAAAALAYGNSLRVPFLLDDASAILYNRTIARPISLSSVLMASHAGTATGRPLLNLSFALNHVAGGDSVIGYHLVNLGIHALAVLILFGLVRRTLLLKGLREDFSGSAEAVAGVAALIWGLHPLQTEAVTYISQRAESMSGLFYLGNLYAFVRAVPIDESSDGEAWKARHRAAWLAASGVSCLCAVATKEVAVTAPVLVLLYDRVFLSGSFREALRRRRGYYASLAASWVFLGVILSLDRLSGRSVGYGLGVDAVAYLLTEAKAVATYVRLALWPASLTFDYGREYLVSGVGGVLPEILAVIGLLALAGVMWRRSPRLGFLLVAFFAILAPTSSIVPIAAQPAAESRMYLALAPLILLAMLGVVRLLGRPGIAVMAAVAILLGGLTVVRNRAYVSSVSIWEDTVAKAPSNSRAHDNLGVALSRAPGMQTEAVLQYREALQIRPAFPEAHRDLAVELSRMDGGSAEAVEHFREAIRLKPDFPEAETGLGVELGKIPGRSSESVEHLRAAIQLDPNYPEGHSNLAGELARLPGGVGEAIGEYRTALRLDPNLAEAYNGLAVALTQVPGGTDEALEHLGQAIRIRPGYITAMDNRAKVLSTIPGRRTEAIEGFEEVLATDPHDGDANFGLGRLLMESAASADAGLNDLSKACQIYPRRLDIQIALANALLGAPGRLGEAKGHFEAALAIAPDLPEAHNGLGVVLAKEGDFARAIVEFEAAVRLRPSFREAADNLRAVKGMGGN